MIEEIVADETVWSLLVMVDFVSCEIVADATNLCWWARRDSCM